MLQKRIIEICANSARSCVEAEAGGATRVELCTAIPEGGTTPSYGEIQAAQAQTSVTFHRAFDVYRNPNVPIKYTINISSRPRFSGKTVFYDVDGSHEKMIYRRYIFKLVTLSPSAYMYLKSRTRYDDYGNNDFTSEPTIIYNNIPGGLGILGAFHTDTTPILMPEE